MNQRRPAIVLFVLSILLYGQTIGYEFVLDDKIVITKNEFTKKGFAGIGDVLTHDSMTGFFGGDRNLVAGGRYRPLSMATHAIEWQFFGENPFMYHLINILLYGLSCMVLYWVLVLMFREYKAEKWYLSIPFLATLLWLVHPLHTEVVANVKSRDELMSILGGLASLYFFLRYTDEQDRKLLIWSTVLLFLSLLSKESSVVFVAIIPLTIYFFRPASFKQTLTPSLWLVGATVLYVAIRYAVLGSAKLDASTEWMNNPFLHASSGERMATLFLTFILYLKLLVFPHPLTHDYYPEHIPIVGWDDPLVLLSLIVHIGLLFVMIRGFKRRSLYAYAIAFYLVTFALYSNVVFNIGTFMNERFMYMPSLAMAIALVYALYQIKSKQVVLGIVVVYSVLLSWKTVDRSQVWESDETLSITDVEVSVNSAKAQMAAGSSYIDMAAEERNENKKRAHLIKATEHLSKSLAIHKSYFPPMILMGNALTELEMYAEAQVYYDNCLRLKPGDSHATNNLLVVAQRSFQQEQFDVSIKAYESLLRIGPNPDYYNALGEIYGKSLNDLPAATKYLEEGLKRYPSNAGLLQKMGVVYALQGNTVGAIDIFKRTLKLDPDNARLYLNVGIAYRNLGEADSSEKYLRKAFEIEPELRNN